MKLLYVAHALGTDPMQRERNRIIFDFVGVTPKEAEEGIRTFHALKAWAP